MNPTHPLPPTAASKKSRSSLWLCLIAIALCAGIYLSQSGRVSAANAELQAQQQRTQRLNAQRQQELLELGRVTSPAYIFQQARNLGMEPGNWGDPGSGQP